MNRQRALIVDDEPDIRELLEITLGRMKLDTRSARNVKEAREWLAREPFDLCLTDMRLPDGLTLTGGDGLTRSFFRTKFWEDDPKTYGDIVFQPDALPEPVARTPLSSTQKNSLLRYGVDEPLLFVGHYWRSGKPAPIRPNLACLDYSAVLYGKLVAYRLDQETQLDPRKFVWVDVERPEAIP